MSKIPEQVHVDAAQAYARRVSSRSDHAAEVARRSAADPAFRAAIELAYRAGRSDTVRPPEMSPQDGIERR